MIASERSGGPGLGWGAPWQLWACRLSHILGLVAVLTMLVVLGAVAAR